MCQFDCVTVGNIIDDCYAKAKKVGHPAFYFSQSISSVKSLT